jgi:protoheme IX farnesyltransferase
MSGNLISSPAPFGSSTVVDGVAERSVMAARLADYLLIVKPRISLMVLLTVSAGYYLGCRGIWNFWILVQALCAIALVAAGSSALNQFLERETDARMPRTANRPLPTGRMSSREVLTFGILAGVAGTLWLAIAVNVLTAALAAGTWFLYVAAYTPLKRRTAISTVVGAIPGALPPVLGWTAAGAPLDMGALALFGTLFLWQFPHFLAIAWLYREEYARAGLKMIPAAARAPRVAGLLAIGYASVLIPMSVQPALCGLAGRVYLVVALVLGLIYAAAAARFAWKETTASARQLLTVSLIYLPLLLLALVGDHWRLLS